MLQQINTILDNIKTYDNVTYRHSINVSLIGKYLAKECGFKNKEIEMTEITGLLHDCGKLKIKKDILLKSGILTSEEFCEIKCHPKFSRDIILQYMDNSDLLGNFVVEHHERNDGSGYPNKKCNFEIAKISKIISIADSYDAMKSVRCYKPKMDDVDIINEFIKCKDQYEEKYVEKMIMLIQNNRFEKIYLNEA